MTDLRFGNVRHDDWEGRDRFAGGEDLRALLPLPEGVACHAIAGVLKAEASGKAETDGLVPTGSALGRGATPERELGFAESARWIAYETGHLDRLDSPQVYAKLEEWLR